MNISAGRGMAEKTASFTIPIHADSDAREAAEDLDALRKKIFASQDAVKDFGAAMRSLRGATDEVKNARSDLKAKLEAERDALSRHNLALVKQGTTYEKLARQERLASKAMADQKKVLQDQKKALDEDKKSTEALHKAVSTVGGPVATLREKFDSLKSVLGGAQGAQGAFTVGAAVAAAAIALVVAVVVEVAKAVVDATIAFTKFVIEGANAARTMRLMREAAGGSASNATALGNQVDALSRKVATSKAELNDMSLDMTRAFLGTRVSGEGLVDTFNAVAQVSEVMGKQAGSAIEGIIERSKQWGRMGIGLFELQGTGVSFEDVAGKLAKQLKIGLDAARLQLRMGMVDVNAGAKALRSAIEDKFARLNLAKMLDFDVLKMKFQETLSALTKGVNLEPLLKAFEKLSALFSETTVTGTAMKTIVTDLGNALVGGAAGGADFLTKAIKQLVIWALELDIAFLRSKKRIAEFFENRAAVLIFKAAIVSLISAIVGIGVIFGLVAAVIVGALAIIVGPFVLAGLLIWGLYEAGKAAWEALKNIKWSAVGDAIMGGLKASLDWILDLGRRIIEGITNGIRAGWNALVSGVTQVADGIKNTFKDLLGIHSPSAVFADYGRQTVAGYAQGVDAEAPTAAAAISAMAPIAPSSAASGDGASGARGGPISVTVEINVDGSGHGQETAKALSAPDFLSGLTKAIEEALLGAGVPTQQGAGA